MGESVIVKALKLHVDNFCYHNEPGGCPKKDDCDGISPGSTHNKNQLCPHYIFREALDAITHCTILDKSGARTLLDELELKDTQITKLLAALKSACMYSCHHSGFVAPMQPHHGERTELDIHPYGCLAPEHKGCIVHNTIIGMGVDKL